MAGLLGGKTAVVTGGSSGIGRAICLRFAEEGANVVVADVRDSPREGGEPTHELAAAEGVSATFVECDVTDAAQVGAAVDAADEFGGIDVMVNNAGIYRVGSFVDVSEDEYDTLMDVNAKGVFLGSQAAARKMVEQGRGGSIINMSSVAGITGSPNNTAYCTSKGGVRLLTYAIAADLGPEGIRANAIHPGLIETTMTKEDIEIFGTEMEAGYVQTIPLRRPGQPVDIANTALYLASDLSSYVTGESIIVDGGMTYAG